MYLYMPIPTEEEIRFVEQIIQALKVMLIIPAFENEWDWMQEIYDDLKDAYPFTKEQYRTLKRMRADGML